MAGRMRPRLAPIIKRELCVSVDFGGSSSAPPPPSTAFDRASPAAGLGCRVKPDLLSALVANITVTAGPHAEIAVHAPYTGEVIGSIPAGSESDVALAVCRARTAQFAWAALPVRDRARIMLRFHDLLLDRQEQILDIIQLETGKARRHAFEEVLDTVIVSRHYALRAEKLLHPRRAKGAFPGLTKTWEFRSPVGVAGFIVPWNYPLNLAVTDAIPALLAGNTVVLKPDHQTSFHRALGAQLTEGGRPAPRRGDSGHRRWTHPRAPARQTPWIS